MTLFRDVLAGTEEALVRADIYCGHGYESPHDEAVALVLAAADLPPETGAEILDQSIAPAALDTLAHYLIARTQARLPTAYITGRAWLGPLCFKADPRALVPRSPLMELIAYEFRPWWQGTEPKVIVDVCCGGGSLGLLAAAQFPDSRVELMDLDADALALAEENLALHGFANAHLSQADLLGALKPATVDVILANPPYVDAEDMASLPPEYLHEPRFALEAGTDGLALVHRLMAQAANVLNETGVMFMEVGNSWEALEQAYPHHAFTWVEFESGGHGVCALSQSELKLLAPQAAALAEQV